jgi:hypothetical protein
MNKLPKTAASFVCDNCDFICYKQSNYDKHLLTSKHKNRTILNNLEQKMPKTAENLFNCTCGKTYTARNSLWYHKQKCTQKAVSESDEEFASKPASEPIGNDIIMLLIKENSELKNMMMKVLENGTHNTTNNTNMTNSNNKAFNLNFFLNETCKDAMNIMDFVDSIKLQLSDLEKVGEVGYVEGISNIIVKNLNELDVTQRPVHCTDKKRETMYIKDEDKWEKDENNSKIKKAIKRVASKNQRLLPKFKEAHPDCGTYHSKYSDQYNKIIIESVGGSGDNDAEKEEKIIRNISKNVVVEK